MQPTIEQYNEWRELWQQETVGAIKMQFDKESRDADLLELARVRWSHVQRILTIEDLIFDDFVVKNGPYCAITRRGLTHLYADTGDLLPLSVR